MTKEKQIYSIELWTKDYDFYAGLARLARHNKSILNVITSGVSPDDLRKARNERRKVRRWARKTDKE